MLKYFICRNYKNFDEVKIDFMDVGEYDFQTDCLVDNYIGKCLIYGRNGTGKTNLGRAISDIKGIIDPNWVFDGNNDNILYSKASVDAIDFEYALSLVGKDVIYRYSRHSDGSLINEELLIDCESAYKCCFDRQEFVFDKLDLIGVNRDAAEIYKQSIMIDGMQEQIRNAPIPFLRWLRSNTYFGDNKIILMLVNEILRIVFLSLDNQGIALLRTFVDNWTPDLEWKNNLSDFEDYLNQMDMPCKLAIQATPSGQKKLYFDNGRLISFAENASSGTIALTEFYWGALKRPFQPSVLFLDEFDAFYHYEVAEKIIRLLKKKYPKSQIIITTHNTNLMSTRLMRPDCLFILSNEKKLTSLNHATLRELKEGYNLEKMYLSGEFDKYE